MLKESELKKIQDKINYRFANKQLLQQAFTRKSFVVSRGGQHNDVMEFFGDRILDFAVTKDLCDQYGKINNKNEFVCSKSSGELSKENCALVKNTNLSQQIARLGFTKYIQTSTKREQTNMKTKADLFEAILGAVAIDSNWNIKAIENVLHAMMYTHDVVEEKDFSAEDYIQLLESEVWKQDVLKTENTYTKTSNGVECSFVMLVKGEPVKIIGRGNSEHLAKIAASEKAYKIIRLVAAHKIIEDEECVAQLYFLFKNGFCAEPHFHFEFFPADSKNHKDLWRCYGTFDSSEFEYECEDENQFEAMEEVSRRLLCEALGIGMDSDDVLPEEEKPVYENERLIHGQGLLKLIFSKYKVA